jgi:pimeloyl-ACP methyl ester carboxylesterase
VVRLATRTWGEAALRELSTPGAAGDPDGRGPASGSRAAGAGPATAGGRLLAVLVHGVISSSRTWWRVAPALVERGFDVLTVDLRGHGSSPPAREGLGLADLAADLAETVQAERAAADGEAPDALHPRPVDLLVGHSLGALVVSQLLATRPGFARRLVLEDPPGISTTDWVALADGIEADGARARSDPDGLRREMIAANPDEALGDADRRVTDLAECDTGAIAVALRQRVVYDLPGLMRSVEVPTLLLVGEEPLGSALVGPDRAALVAALRQGTVEVLPTGHNLHREAFDAFMAALDRWLD